ncbi:hypothetical protein TIFTF001_025292 [Ficus carica]|uniref:Uncharacterized protein n=1 Tax=Ficus carica TaxID=3494 RepID=A0AA88AMQ9_FICCA|nr:hypothetical protein TIFTF001_025292 [Ficus carica]
MEDFASGYDEIATLWMELGISVHSTARRWLCLGFRVMTKPADNEEVTASEGSSGDIDCDGVARKLQLDDRDDIFGGILGIF